MALAEVLARGRAHVAKHGFRRSFVHAIAKLAERDPERLDRYLIDHVAVLRPDQGITLGFAPAYPRMLGYQIRKVCKALSLHPVHGAEADLTMFWHDTTKASESPEGAINWRVRDISKRRVAHIFKEVFGYALEIDPRTHSGDCVEKTDEDGLHAGSIVRCPRDARAGFVYQKVIDNRVGNDVEDLRTVVVGHEIPIVYRKRRPAGDRFSNTNRRVDLAKADELFSPDELRTIFAFCARMGLDYGELDILRDRADGRIYVVDVNKTTFGPPNHLRIRKRFEAIEAIARAFERQFLAGVTPRTAASRLRQKAKS